jgi:uncharacterized protein YndB with AHSA1/START domain
MAAIKPVRAAVTVEAPKERAFDVFTAEMSTWWPRSYRIGAADLEAAVLEPRAGSRWYERGADGSECEWGRVLTYDPPRSPDPRLADRLTMGLRPRASSPRSRSASSPTGRTAREWRSNIASSSSSATPPSR